MLLSFESIKSQIVIFQIKLTIKFVKFMFFFQIFIKIFGILVKFD